MFLSCGSFLPGQNPCGYFQWLHGPLWPPREQAQPSLRRWVKETPHGNVPVPLLKKHCLYSGKDEHIDSPLPREWLYRKAPSCVRVSSGRSPTKSEGETVVESICRIDQGPGQGDGEKAPIVWKQWHGLVLKKKKPCRCVEKKP